MHLTENTSEVKAGQVVIQRSCVFFGVETVPAGKLTWAFLSTVNFSLGDRIRRF